MTGYRKPIVFFTMFSRGAFFIPFFHCHHYSHPHEREQGTGIPHTPAHVTTCVPWHRWHHWAGEERCLLHPSLTLLGLCTSWPLHGPSPRGWQDAGTWQELAREPECGCVSVEGEEKGQVWILLSDNTSSNLIMGNFRGHHGIDWLGQSWQGCVGARQSTCNRIPSISLINSHRMGEWMGARTKLHKYIRKSQEITLQPKNLSTTLVTLSPQHPGQGEH